MTKHEILAPTIGQYVVIATPPDRKINKGYYGHHCDACSPTFPKTFYPDGLKYDAIGVFESGEWDNITLCETCYVKLIHQNKTGQ